MWKERPGRTPRLWGSLGALCAMALCFCLGMPARNPERVPAAATARVAREAAEDPLDAFRREREQVRSLEIEQLRAVAGDESADPEIRAQANRQLLSLTEYMEQEVTLEGLLGAQGFLGAVCSVHADSVNVLVPGSSVTRAQSALILDAAMRETGQSGGSVKIIPVP